MLPSGSMAMFVVTKPVFKDCNGLSHPEGSVVNVPEAVAEYYGMKRHQPPVPEVEAEAEVEAGSDDLPDYESMSLKELKAAAADAGIEVEGRTKAAYVEALASA